LGRPVMPLVSRILLPSQSSPHLVIWSCPFVVSFLYSLCIDANESTSRVRIGNENLSASDSLTIQRCIKNSLLEETWVFDDNNEYVIESSVLANSLETLASRGLPINQRLDYSIPLSD
jgi:hypothetical protein